MKDIRKSIIAILEKIFEKSILGSSLVRAAPIFSSLVRAAPIFNPDLLLELSKQKLIDRSKVLLKHSMIFNICSATQCDQVLADFSTFYQNELKHAKLNGSKFKKDKDCLHIYVKELCVLPYKELPFVIQIILTMSHVQAAVERGFNINNSVLKTNISREGVKVKRLVKDHLLANNLKPHTIQITNPIVRALKVARQNYATYLNAKDEEKAKHITSDIENLKQKLKANQKNVQ